MIDIYLLIDVLIIVLLLGLGVVVSLKDKSAQSSRTFLFFVISVSAWIISNYISNDLQQSAEVAKLANYVVFSSSYFAIYFLLRFSIVLTEYVYAERILRYTKYPLVLIGLSGCTPLVVKGVEVQDKVYAVVFGPAVGIYAAGLLFALAAVPLVLGIGQGRTRGSHHDRIRTLLFSYVLFVPLLVIVQFILPVATGWFGLTNIGVLLMLGVTYGFYSAVVRHHLFDLRSFIVRSVAYVLSLGIVSLLYGIASYYLASVVIVQSSTTLHFIANTCLIILIIFSYQPLKNIFRRLTNKLFYQDIYDGEALLVQLNQLLVVTTDMKSFLTKTAQLLVKTMCIEYCRISIYIDDVQSKVRSYGSFVHEVNNTDLSKIEDYIKHSHEHIVITERLSSKYQAVKDILIANNIAAILLLASTNDSDDRIGYMLLGAKKSGYSYYDNDCMVLETIAGQLAIATQNALNFEKIQEFNRTLQQKVEEETKKLRVTNEKLKKMDEAKDEFISMASHQLRTPLTSVKGYVSMVLDGDVGPITDQQRQLLKQSFLSSERMANLISDLLNLSRINTGKFVMELVPIDLRQIIATELEQLRDTAESKGLSITYKAPETFPTLTLDENKMHQVVMNLVDNAIYYTHEGGTITLTLTETPTAVEFRVTDTGIGVPRDDQRHLFSKMYRAENARRARPDGTGLGLFMVKKVVVAQGGAILFDSVEGKGSTFGFRFNKADHIVPNSVT